MYIIGEPESKIIYNELQPPLPRVTKRDIVAMKIWVSPSLLPDGKAGKFLIYHVTSINYNAIQGW